MHKYKVRNRILYQWIIYLVVLLFAVSVFRVNFRLEKSTSESMEPTIMVGDYGFAYLKAYSKKNVPRHGDLVVFAELNSFYGNQYSEMMKVGEDAFTRVKFYRTFKVTVK